MAEQATTKKATARKAAPKRKTSAKGAAAARKPAPKRKPATRRTTGRKATPDLGARAQEAGRKAFLASLGFYGKAFEQAQEQFDSLQGRLEERRKKADKLYQELVKRGEKVEKQARSRIDDFELPKLELESLTDRKKLEAQLEKVRVRFDELKNSVGFRTAA
tara:strand:+ start:5796 stop:6281 length:486 start_codon:yes stop_codon:yes gene_type:complete